MLERGRPGGAFSRAAHVPPAKSKDAARLAAFSFFCAARSVVSRQAVQAPRDVLAHADRAGR
jgi:hypothetical protein